MKTKIICLAVALALILPAVGGSVTGNAWAQSGGSISGHIDNGTSLIPGAVFVFQLGPGDSALYRGYVWTGNGNYSFTGLPKGQYSILTQSGGYASEWYDNTYDMLHNTYVDVTAPYDTPNINFSLAPGGSISGHVQASDNGTPISGATILIYEYGRQTGYTNLCGLASTNASGNYTTSGLAAGDYAIQVKAAGYATEWYPNTYNPIEATHVAVTVGSTTPGINFSLAPGASISGRVRRADTGAGIEGVQIYVFDCNLFSLLPDKFPAYDHAWTDQNGDYVIPGLAAGTYQVIVSPAGSLGYSGQRYEGCVSVAPPVNVSNVDFNLECGGYISGYVYQPDNITPVERAQINIYEYFSGSAQWVFRTLTWTDMDGHYETIGLPLQEYKVQVVADGYFTEWYDGFYNEAEAIPVAIVCSVNTSGINFTLSVGSISGHIDNGTGPIPGGAGVAGVWVWQVGPGDSPLYRGVAWTDGDGNYSLIGLPPGQYYLLAQASGYAGEWYDNTYDQLHITYVDVDAPDNMPNINFSLVAGGAISGHIQAANGTPISGALIMVYQPGFQNPLANLCGFKSTDANGDYTTFGLPAGDYTVRVEATGYANEWYSDTYSDTYNPIEATPVAVNVGATHQGINFSLAPGASISGHVQGAGAGIDGVGIFVFDCNLISLLPDEFPVYDYAWTNQNGDYVIPGLAAGEYRVAAGPAGSLGYSGQSTEWQSYEGCVSVAPPVNVSNIDFSLECGSPISGYVYQPDNTTPVERAQINIYEYDSGSAQWVFRTLAWTHMYGHYETIGLPPQEYKVQVVADGYTTEWYDGFYNEAEAIPVEIVCSINTSGITFVLTPYVPVGDNVTAEDTSVDVSVHFDCVTEGGALEVNVSEEAPAPSQGFQFIGKYYDISTGAIYSDNVTVTIGYDEAAIPEGQPEENLRLLHWNDSTSTWDNVTVPPVDTVNNKITGQVTSLSWFVVGVDDQPPLVSITLPDTGLGSGVYLLNQVVSATWLATDAASGVVPPDRGTIPIDTSSVGTKTLTVLAGTAVDKAGNPSAQTTAPYSVRYAFGGILQPINADGSSIFKLGSTVPVKFQLRDANGNFVTTAVANIWVAKVSNNVAGTDAEAVSTSAATTGNLFRYDSTSNQYIFNLATKPLSVGTWQIKIVLNDVTSKTVTISLR